MSEKMDLQETADGFDKLLEFEKLQKDWSDSAREASIEARKNRAADPANLKDRRKDGSAGLRPWEKTKEFHKEGNSIANRQIGELKAAKEAHPAGPDAFRYSKEGQDLMARHEEEFKNFMERHRDAYESSHPSRRG